MSEPTRLAGSPAMGEPALGLSPVSVVERSPTGLALIPQLLVKIGVVMGALGTVGTAIFTALLPAPWAATGLGISAALATLGATVASMGPGLRKDAGTQPVTLAAPGIPPSAPTPRIGPPV